MTPWPPLQPAAASEKGTPESVSQQNAQRTSFQPPKMTAYFTGNIIQERRLRGNWEIGTSGIRAIGTRRGAPVGRDPTSQAARVIAGSEVVKTGLGVALFA